MTQPLTPERLAEMRARCEAATPGPWAWWTSCSWRRLRQIQQPEAHVLLPVVCSDGHPDLTVKEEDREFIAHARTDLPALLDEVERLTRERDEAISALHDLEWRVAANAQPRDEPRWSGVCRATGYGSTMAWELCRRAGVDPDEIRGEHLKEGT